MARGAGGDDTLAGNGGNDVLYGGFGDDYLDGGLGINRLRGAVTETSVTTASPICRARQSSRAARWWCRTGTSP